MKRVLGVPLHSQVAATKAPDRKRSRADSRPHRVRIAPQLPSSFYGDLQEILDTQAEFTVSALRHAARNTVQDGGGASARRRAMFHLLADLVGQGWALEAASKELWLSPPASAAHDGEPVEAVKDRLRASLKASRDAQLADPPVAAFLKRMETRRLHKGRRVSVLTLVDDGHSLAAALQQVAGLLPAQQDKAVENVIQPVIEVITSGAVCTATGLALLDVWRYFRHTWALEYRATPGRTLFFLVRNAARPHAPVIGIGSLASAIPQLRVRDDWIKWSLRSTIDTIQALPASWARHQDAILRTLADAKSLVRQDDLLTRVGGATGLELERRLYALAEVAASRRESALRERQVRLERGDEVRSLRRLPRLPDGETDWETASESPLFVRKRATTLADLLFGERVIASVPRDGELFLKELSLRSDVRRALSIGLREIRKVGLASRLLEVNVCGAVPPYRELLAGKLLALATASTEIAGAYRRRYRDQHSEIASQMAGRAVLRAPDLCALTTTSLYGVAASQYNRLRVSVSLPDGPHVLHWRDLGLTEGFGTVHLSEETLVALRAVNVVERGGRNVNNVFGEGNSPRLRQAREGLEALGIPSDAILRHASPRRVYGLDLAEGATDALRHNTNVPLRRTPFSAIADAWRRRWLVARLANLDVLGRVAEQGPESVRAELSVKLGRHAPPSGALPRQATVKADLKWRALMPQFSDVDLVQNLYRATSSCADHHDARTIDLLHIDTPVDRFIRDQAVSGTVVFITGNPGDGKTHVIRRMSPDLRAANVEVCLDANERSDEDLVHLVATSSRERRGCVIAINEGILVALLQSIDDDWAAEVKKQLLEPYEYTGSNGRAPNAPSPAGTVNGRPRRVRVVDLNLRNNLGRDIVLAALKRQIECLAPCDGCPALRCDGQFNAKRLAQAPVAESLVALLDAVARSGYHATMRDLHAFIAFLLFAGKTCDEVKHASASASPYWENAFAGGSGPLFDAVRRLDPKIHPAPLLDDILWRHSDQTPDWTVALDEDAPPAMDLEERRRRFESRKRRAYFEHVRGAILLDIAESQPDRAIRELLDRHKGARDLVRLLNRFFDRDEDRGDVLYLWVSHRYDARPNRYAAFSNTVPTTELEVLLPGLSTELMVAFPDHHADHVVLTQRTRPVSEGLRIDRQLLEALLAAEHGLPSTFRPGEPETRVASFYDRLARLAANAPADPVVQIGFVDMDTGGNFHLNVDVPARRYQRR